ncbi:MAG: hypothetical protein E7558_02300 [Ruminococcaceae bacterium]|nr:hypothetical protein [Oscillospiraceae bacterium]MBQ6874126.1 hypothetical protein [Clostridia bacterium]
MKTFTDKMHTWGRIWTVSAIAVLFMVPLGVTLYYNAWPEFSTLWKALISVIPIYWATAIIEVITYTPLLGAGGTYLSFVTGNITNLKLPCALSALDRAKVKATSEEGEIISTIAIASSSITTTLVIAVGVLLFAPVLPTITAPDSVIKPAFDYVIPALFGALGASYFSKHWKISILPILAGVIVYILAPSFAVGTLLFVTIVVSIAGALGMYKLGWIKE